MAATYIFYRLALTGGSDNALDGIDGGVPNDGDGGVVFYDGEAYLYLFDADSGASESSPDVIAPDSNPGNGRWVLQDVHVNTASNAQAAAMAATDAFLVPGNLDQALNLHLNTAHLLNNATYMAFRLNFWNDSGLLKHNVTGMITGGGVASNFASKLSYASTTYNQTKNLGPSVGFNAGLGVASERIIFDVADAGSYSNLASGSAKAIYCRCDDTSLSLPLSFRFDASYTDINGVIAYRPSIQVLDVTSSYVSLYSALSTGKALTLDVEGYFY